MASQAPSGAPQMLEDLANTCRQLAEQAEQRMPAAKKRHGRERRLASKAKSQ
jgi:hypothetical protein